MLALCSLASASHTPVIAIMSHPAMMNETETMVEVEAAGASRAASGGRQYMAASYVKWLELAGARVMPLSYHATDDEVDHAFAQINGALFMGGGAKLPAAARRLWSKASEANAKGDVFPIWGSCLGFEWIMELASGNDKILSNGLDSENLTLPLNLTAAAAKSRILTPAATTPVAFRSPPLSMVRSSTALRFPSLATGRRLPSPRLLVPWLSGHAVSGLLQRPPDLTQLDLA